jgi:hypothetical protein
VIVTFQGASDDLVEIDGAPGADEFNVYDEHGYAGTWLVQETDKGADDFVGLRFYVDAYYRGTWSFALRQVEEGDALPGDMMVLTTTNETENDYTTLLWIDTGEIDVNIQKVEGTE